MPEPVFSPTGRASEWCDFFSTFAEAFEEVSPLL